MEKYGTIPPKFTKKWWEYFWEYYKWHVIVTAALVTMASITTYQVLNQPKYDAVVTYIGEVNNYTQTTENDVANAMKEYVADMDGNGKNDVKFQILAMPDSEKAVENVQYTAALETKKITELQMGEGFAFIVDKTQVDYLYSADLVEGVFLKTSAWADSEILNNSETDEYFVKLSDNKFFKQCGFETDDIYIGIRELRADETEAEQKKQTAALDIANAILKFDK